MTSAASTIRFPVRRLLLLPAVPSVSRQLPRRRWPPSETAYRIICERSAVETTPLPLPQHFTPGEDESLGGELFCRFAVAAGAWGDGVAVGTGFWMAEEAADALIEIGADDVLEFAGLRVSFGIINSEGVFEQALG